MVHGCCIFVQGCEGIVLHSNRVATCSRWQGGGGGSLTLVGVLYVSREGGRDFRIVKEFLISPAGGLCALIESRGKDRCGLCLLFGGVFVGWWSEIRRVRIIAV